MFLGADSASSTSGQPEAAGATVPGPLGSHGPGGEARRRSAPAAAAVVGGGEEEAAEDEEDEDPGSSRFVLAAGLGLLAVSVVHLGQERAEAGGGGPPCLALLLLRLALYVGCAAAAAARPPCPAAGRRWRGPRSAVERRATRTRCPAVLPRPQEPARTSPLARALNGKSCVRG